MWFKLANLTLAVGQHLGSMDSISKSYRIDYALTGLDGSHTSTSFATEGQSIPVTFTFTVRAGYEFKSGSTITCGGSTIFTAGQNYAAGSTFTATANISASVSISGTATAVTPDVPTPDPEEPETPVDPPSGDSSTATRIIAETGATLHSSAALSETASTPESRSGYFTYTYIPVEANTLYKIPYGRRMWQFDASKNPVGSSKAIHNLTPQYEFTTQAGVAYVSITIKDGDVDPSAATIETL